MSLAYPAEALQSSCAICSFRQSKPVIAREGGAQQRRQRHGGPCNTDIEAFALPINIIRSESFPPLIEQVEVMTERCDA